MTGSKLFKTLSSFGLAAVLCIGLVTVTATPASAGPCPATACSTGTILEELDSCNVGFETCRLYYDWCFNIYCYLCDGSPL